MATSKVISVIMGGGRGTRLHPLTMERCKPAVPLAGKYRLVDIPISNCLNSGLNRIFLLTQFNTASLHRHIQTAYRFDPFNGGFVDILAAEQTEKSVDWYQGTADAVRRNLQHFRNCPHEYVLILSGDQLYRMDFSKIIRQHIDTRADVTIAAIPFPASKVEGLGVMRVNDDLSIAEFAEKPKDPEVIKKFIISDKIQEKLTQTSKTEKHCLASMGIYVFNRSVLAEALNTTMKDFGKEIIPGLLSGSRLFSYLFEGYWEDIGTVKSFFNANLALAQPLPPFNFFDEVAPIYTKYSYLPASKINRCEIDYAVISEGSIIEDSYIKHSVFGVRSFVRKGCRVEDVVMMGADFYETPEQAEMNRLQGIPNLGLGYGCSIQGAIIDKDARIGDNVRVSPKGKPDGTYACGMIIRDGVLNIPKGCVVPSNTTL